MVIADRLHPGVNEEVLDLFGCGVNGVVFVHLKQGIGVGFRELVDYGGHVRSQ